MAENTTFIKYALILHNVILYTLNSTNLMYKTYQMKKQD